MENGNIKPIIENFKICQKLFRKASCKVTPQATIINTISKRKNKEIAPKKPNSNKCKLRLSLKYKNEK